ncbi:MAG: DUF4347 domain-containing protein, partial [Planctomycetota bacterium]
MAKSNESLEKDGGNPGSPKPLDCNRLEDRILYSATPLDPQLMDVDADSVDTDFLDEVSFFDSLTLAATDETFAEVDELELQIEVLDDLTDQASEGLELVFVDSSIENHEQLVADLLSNDADASEIVLLNTNEDGIEQISSVLSRHSNVSAVHIVSHGASGQVQLGDAILSADSLDGHADALANWKSALNENADVLFYGCELAADDAGQDFVDAFSNLIDADVASSDDLTGHAELGGDWDFEYLVGDIETEVLFSMDVQRDWHGTLQTVIVTIQDDIINGDVSSISNLIASDGGDGISLREALLAANNTATDDTVLLGSGVHTLSIAGYGNAAGDLDLINAVEIIGAADGSSVIDANGIDRVFHIQTSSATFRNLTIRGGNTSEHIGGGGILVAGGATAVLDELVITENSATTGGGLRSDGFLTVSRTSISNNTATSSGGGVALTSGASTFDAVTINGNVASNKGGGIYVASSSVTHNYDNVTVSGNIAVSGG